MANTLNTIYGDSPAIVRKAWYTGRQVGTTFLRPDHLRTINDPRGIVDYDLAIGDIVQLDPYSPPPTQSQPSDALATTQAGLAATRALGPCVGAPNIGTAHRNPTGSGGSATGSVTTMVVNCVTTPADAIATGIFQPRLYVVTHVHPDINRRSDPNNTNANLARQRDGGWIDVCPMGVVDALFYKNTNILVPAGSPLALWQPGVGAATSLQFLYGSGTANTGKPALSNVLGMGTAIGTATHSSLIDALMRLQAVLMESDDTSGANGGLVAGTTGLKKVAIGGGIWQYGL